MGKYIERVWWHLILIFFLLLCKLNFFPGSLFLISYILLLRLWVKSRQIQPSRFCLQIRFLSNFKLEWDYSRHYFWRTLGYLSDFSATMSFLAGHPKDSGQIHPVHCTTPGTDEALSYLTESGGRRRGWQRMRWLGGHGCGWTPGAGDGQGDLVCCNSWGRKESDTTWVTELNWTTLEEAFSST